MYRKLAGLAVTMRLQDGSFYRHSADLLTKESRKDLGTRCHGRFFNSTRIFQIHSSIPSTGAHDPCQICRCSLYITGKQIRQAADDTDLVAVICGGETGVKVRRVVIHWVSFEGSY